MKGKELNSKIYVTLADGNKYQIEFTMNAMCELEDKFGSFQAIGEAFKEPKLKHIRTLLWSGLLEHNDMTEKEAGSLIDLNDMESLVSQIMKAFEMSFPAPKKEENVGEAEVGK